MIKNNFFEYENFPKSLTEYCVAEYSPSQKEFHCDYLSFSLHRNIDNVIKNTQVDWMTIGIFPTWEEAQEFIEKIKSKNLKN